MSESDRPSSEAAASGACPVPLDILSPQARKPVSPATPVKVRKMAAKGVIPMPPVDTVIALFILTFDEDEEVRQTAQDSVRTLPDRILGPTLRGELPPPVLDFLAKRLSDKPEYLEAIVLNNAVSDETFAELARTADEKVLGIITENQLRLLRHPDIIRGIAENPSASQATIDRVFDFAVRSGANLPDVAAFQEARRRILGDAAVEKEVPREETAEGLMEVHSDVLATEEDVLGPDDQESAERETLTQQILRMSVSEKIKLAMLGNKEARTILLRDPNKLVQEAVVNSPRVTEGELVGLTNSRTIPDTVLRHILNQRDIMRIHQVKVNLCNNPKTPLPTAMKLLPHLRVTDLRNLSRNRNVPQALSTQAKNLLEKKGR